MASHIAWYLRPCEQGFDQVILAKSASPRAHQAGVEFAQFCFPDALKHSLHALMGHLGVAREALSLHVLFGGFLRTWRPRPLHGKMVHVHEPLNACHQPWFTALEGRLSPHRCDR